MDVKLLISLVSALVAVGGLGFGLSRFAKKSDVYITTGEKSGQMKFVTRDEFAELKADIKSLTESFNGLDKSFALFAHGRDGET